MDRTFHNETGHVTYTDSGLFTFPFDRNGLNYLKPFLPDGVPATCADVPYCGWPYLLPVIHVTHLEYVCQAGPDLASWGKLTLGLIKCVIAH